MDSWFKFLCDFFFSCHKMNQSHVSRVHYVPGAGGEPRLIRRVPALPELTGDWMQERALIFQWWLVCSSHPQSL